MTSTGAQEMPPPERVTAGRFVLHRAPAEFPDELLYVARVSERHDVWLKSLNMLAGPWEWTLQQDGAPFDISVKRFPTRTEATADLAAAVESLLGAAAESEAADFAPVPAAAVPAPSAAADPEVLAMAIDLAILTLQKARSTIGAAAGR